MAAFFRFKCNKMNAFKQIALFALFTYIIVLVLVASAFIKNSKNKKEEYLTLDYIPTYVSSRSFYDFATIKNKHPRSSYKHLDTTEYEKIKDRDVVYVVTEGLHSFQRNILPMLDLKIRFVLIIGDSDLSFDESYISIIEDPRISHVFSQNCEIEHIKVTRIPIGMDFHTLHASENISREYQNQRLFSIANEATLWNKRKSLIYCNVSFHTNPLH